MWLLPILSGFLEIFIRANRMPRSRDLEDLYGAGCGVMGCAFGTIIGLIEVQDRESWELNS